MTDQLQPSFVGEIIGEGMLRVLHRVGAGSMGEVYAAERTDTGERVAVKLLHAHLAANEEYVKRFKREVDITRHVKSRFAAGVYSRGKWEGRPWVAFVWLDGESLQARLDRAGALPGAEVAPIVEDVLLGLIDVHETINKRGTPLRIVHRDLKPANIFLERLPVVAAANERRERARLLDFGISKLAASGIMSSSEPSLTSTGSTLGTPVYMAPEQGDPSVPVDARADLYSVGVLVFHLLSGQFPYPGGSMKYLLALKRNYAPRRLSDAVGFEVPAAVEQFVERLLAKESSHRFATARETLKAWRTLLPMLLCLPTVTVPPSVRANHQEGLNTEVEP
jgi:serine/threonine protein kinase